MQLKVGILMGGFSEEKEISVLSGNAVADACIKNNFSVKKIIFEGKNTNLIKSAEEVDIIFNALHGGDGENGKVQSFLRANNIKYTGSDATSSKLCMNKEKTKRIVQTIGLKTPKWELISNSSNIPNINFPYIIKPNEQGSTVGLSIVENKSMLKKSIIQSLKFSKDVLAESYIKGRELAVSILDDSALPIIEIVPSKIIYDYECKYTPGKSSYLCPANLNPTVEYNIKKDSELIFKELGCSGYGRADFILDNNQNYHFLEMNTLPGMTETSLLPKSAAAAGISFDALISNIIKKSL